MKTRLRTIPVLLLFVLLGASVLVAAEGQPSPLGIVPSPTPGSLSVSVWTNKSTYVVGETAQIYFTVNQPAYVYLYDLQPDGVIRLVFPNAYSQSNYVGPGTHVLPDGNYQFMITPPLGVERLQLIASPTPLNLAPSLYSEPYPQATPEGIQGHIMGITPTPTYATAWTSFTIVGGGYGYGYTPPATYPTPPPYTIQPQPCPSCPPSPGWFPGGSWYWHNGSWVFGIPGSTSGWYWYCGPDGKWHFTLRIRIGTGD